MNRIPHRLLWCFASFSIFALVGCGDDGEPSADPWGAEGFVPGEPLPITTDETWSFVPIEGSVCGDGTPSGLFVNATERSRELVLFLLGGGVCYDRATCALMPREREGLGEDPLSYANLTAGIFDRDDPENPFRDANFVVLPHCTGDFHLADRVNDYPGIGKVHQRGHGNVKRALRRVAPTFADASRITFAGFSAGGVGVTGNYHLVASAFRAVGAPLPFLVNDGGPLLRPPYLGVKGQETIAAAWGLEDTLFRWCRRCKTDGFHEIFGRLHELYPELRSSVVCAYGDAVVVGLYTLMSGFGFVTASGGLEGGLLDFSDYTSTFPESTSGGAQREFFYESTRHGALVVGPLSETPGLADFLRAQLEGSGDFETVH